MRSLKLIPKPISKKKKKKMLQRFLIPKKKNHFRKKKKTITDFLSFMFELSLFMWNDTYKIMVGYRRCVGVVCGVVCVGLYGG